jgi:hypothetical protein
MSTTNEELLEEIEDLKRRITSLELDISLLKSIRVAETYYPVNPWVPSYPTPNWVTPTVFSVKA